MTKIKELRALSIAQPWVQCIVAKGENIENRDWNAKFRGYFAIHASRSRSKDRLDACSTEYRIKFDMDDVPLGAQSFWKLKGRTIKSVLQQLQPTQIKKIQKHAFSNNSEIFKASRK
jgi:hypothetical protein